MVKIVNGHSLDATEDIIAHQVNCMGKSGRSINKIVEIYPKVGVEYFKLCNGAKNPVKLLGTIQPIQIKSANKIIANLFCEFNHGSNKVKTNYEELSKCLKALCKFARKRNLSVALPYKIAASESGDNWQRIYSMIENSFFEYSVSIYKSTYR